MASFRRALPSFARCERPRLSVLRFWKDHPGRFAQGPDEKKGARGRAAGRLVMVSILSDGRLSVGRGVPPTGMTEAWPVVKAGFDRPGSILRNRNTKHRVRWGKLGVVGL